jgi:hypothetical protein
MLVDPPHQPDAIMNSLRVDADTKDSGRGIAVCLQHRNSHGIGSYFEKGMPA